MKIYNILLLFCFALFLTSCITSPEHHPIEEDFLCVINADGTGFQKFPYPGIHGEIWDMYVTKDGKLIFASDKYYITDPDSIIPVPFIDITSDSYGLTLANDGKAYYCQNGDLYKYDFVTQTPNNLTESIDGFFTNPIISPDESIITLLSISQDSTNTSTLCYISLSDNSMHLIPQAGTSTRRGIYSPLTHKIYHEQSNGFYKIDLAGTQNIQLLDYPSIPKQTFGFTSLNDNLVTLDGLGTLRIFNIQNEATNFSQQLSYLLIMAKMPKEANKVFFMTNGIIYYYDLDNQIKIQVPHTSGAKTVLCPTWDGKKIYFLARLRINK